ncbi:MAG: type IX secretion system protein PorQ [Paludibacteraceae bacterium]|nr:type IX secretion system protein PorQ [Paludibacteraceae bacterium]MBQ9296986.1 type IX secretion system protein PorQ [Paludibacteraceae bacterium]
MSLGTFGQVSNAGRSVFSFMSLPTSSRINALGGSNVSLSDGDVSMGMCNPALLHNETHMVLQLNYSYYLPGTMFGSVLYGHNFGEAKAFRSTDDGKPERPNYFAVGVHYLDYGRMQYADEHGNLTGGAFGARDILIDVMYARQLHPCWKIGVTLKPVYSIYEAYSSFAIGADIGAHFQTRDSTFQMGLVLQNIGWQIKGFYSAEGGSNHEMLPLNLQLGLTYRIKHAPLRFHLQIHNMQTWYLNYEWTSLDKSPTTGEILPHDVKWYDMLFRHTIFSLEIVPKSERFYIALSYNHRRRAELHLTDQKSLAGFSLGAGVRIKQARIGFAISQLTKSNFSYQAGLTLDINSLMK